MYYFEEIVNSLEKKYEENCLETLFKKLNKRLVFHKQKNKKNLDFYFENGMIWANADLSVTIILSIKEKDISNSFMKYFLFDNIDEQFDLSPSKLCSTLFNAEVLTPLSYVLIYFSFSETVYYQMFTEYLNRVLKNEVNNDNFDYNSSFHNMELKKIRDDFMYKIVFNDKIKKKLDLLLLQYLKMKNMNPMLIKYEPID